MMIFFVCVFSKLDRMESKLNEKVSKLQGCQERRLQLEENIQRLQPQLRDMKNTMEKYSNSMTVRQILLLRKQSSFIVFTHLGVFTV